MDPDNPIRVRDAVSGEHQAASEAAVRAFSAFSEWIPPEEWPALADAVRSTTAADPLGRLLIAESNGTIVGSVRYAGPGHGGHPVYPDRYAYVRTVAVLPERAGRGIGTALVRACIAAAQADGADAIGLHVADRNHRARKLYARLGFRFFRPAPDLCGLRYRAYRLRLPSWPPAEIL